LRSEPSLDKLAELTVLSLTERGTAPCIPSTRLREIAVP
jgi:hypothetical protein